MTDREALFAACRGPEDTPRLILADFLEEHGTTDLDKAVSEFIRVSCDLKAGGREIMPRKAFGWLEDNWFRLVPRVIAFAMKQANRAPGVSVCLSPNEFLFAHYRQGRRVWCRLPFGLQRDFHPGTKEDWVVQASVVFEFSRGFLESFRITHTSAMRFLIHRVRTDWPNVRLTTRV